MPNQPKTPLHSFRVADDIWHAAQQSVAADGTDLSKVLREHVERLARGERWEQP